MHYSYLNCIKTIKRIQTQDLLYNQIADKRFRFNQRKDKGGKKRYVYVVCIAWLRRFGNSSLLYLILPRILP